MFKFMTINMEKPLCDCFNTESEYRDNYYWNLVTEDKTKNLYLVIVCRKCDTSLIIPQNKVGALFSFDKIESHAIVKEDNDFSNVIVFDTKTKNVKKSSDIKLHPDLGENKNEPE